MNPLLILAHMALWPLPALSLVAPLFSWAAREDKRYFGDWEGPLQKWAGEHQVLLIVQMFVVIPLVLPTLDWLMR